MKSYIGLYFLPFPPAQKLLLTSVGLGQVTYLLTPAEFLWTPCLYSSRGGPSPCHCRHT